MSRLTASLASLAAVAGVAALALFFAGVFDGHDASGNDRNGSESAGVCIAGNPDCGDTGFVSGDDDGGTVAPGCEVGHVGPCNDTPMPDDEAGELFGGDEPVIEPVCAPGFPDCADTIVNEEAQRSDGKIVPIGTFDQDDVSSDGSSSHSGGAVADGVQATVDPLVTTGGTNTPE